MVPRKRPGKRGKKAFRDIDPVKRSFRKRKAQEAPSSR